MTYTGQVQGGQVVPDGPAPPDGTPVRVEPADDGLTPRMRALIAAARAADPAAPTLAERWPSLLTPALDLPPDASAQVDHYLNGTPKR